MDRNRPGVGSLITLGGSLSARRAWIEIGLLRRNTTGTPVALRKESVDRNNFGRLQYDVGVLSLSARRAWIEMRIGYKFADLVTSRSPQGERG